MKRRLRLQQRLRKNKKQNSPFPFPYKERDWFYEKKYRVAVIGCGVISSSHLVPLSEQENTEIAAVCDIKKERADAKAAEFGCKAYYDYKEMIDSEQLDSVHVCLPHYLHSTVSIYALQHGLDVLCEKPLISRLKKSA